MTTKHTPGPWIALESDSTTMYVDDAFGFDGGRDYYLAEIRHGDPVELKANARLISAAPDLLELVKTANHGTKGAHTAMWQTAARAAIAKAT